MFEVQILILLFVILGYFGFHSLSQRKLKKLKLTAFLRKTYQKKDEKRKLIVVSVELLLFVFLVYLGLTMKVFWVAVVSNSMAPTFYRGDMVLIQTINKDPKPGDIVMFYEEEFNLPVTHRVLRVSGNLVYTGGDSSGPDSSPVSKDKIIGKAIMIFGRPVVIKGVGNYFILNAVEMRDITPYGEEYLFYKRMIDTFRQYAIAIVIIALSLYVYLSVREMRG